MASCGVLVRVRQNRWILYCISVCHVLCTGGVVFGWHSLVPILTKLGTFGDLNKDDRKNMFASVFLVGTIGTMLNNVPAGLTLDRFGPRTLSIGSAVAMICGSLLIWGTNDIGEWALFIGYFLLGMGGPSVQLAALGVAELFTRRSTVLGSITAFFDTATTVFLLFKVLYSDGLGVQWTQLWMGYIAILLLIALSALLLWPDTHFAKKAAYQNSSEDRSITAPKEETAVEKIETPADDPQKMEMEKKEDAPRFLQQVLSLEWLFFVSILSVNIAHAIVTFGAIDGIIKEAVLGSELDTMFTVFGVIVPCSFIWAPVIGTLLDTQPREVAYAVINCMGIIYALCFIFASNHVALLVCGFVILAPHRQFAFSTLFSQIGAMFGFVHYGKHAGLITLVVAIASTIQFPLLIGVDKLWEGKHMWIHIIFIIFTVPLFIPIALALRKKRAERRSSKKEATTTLAKGCESFSASQMRQEVEGCEPFSASQMRQEVEGCESFSAESSMRKDVAI